MSIADRNGGSAEFEISEVHKGARAVRAHLAIVRESDGTFSAIVLNLKGCGSCGSTEEEAVTRAREAVAGMVQSFTADNEEVPWCEATDADTPEGAKTKWIMVNV